jgi:hypothetical protein
MPLTKIQSLGITDGTIVNADINASAAIAGTKLSGAGKVLQVVSADTTTSVNTTTTTYTDSGLTASITPSSASNKVLILISQQLQHFQTSGNWATLKYKLLRDATIVYESEANVGFSFTYDYGASGINLGLYQPLTILDLPSSTSSLTYKTQIAEAGNGGAGANAQTSGNKSFITLIEIAG